MLQHHPNSTYSTRKMHPSTSVTPLGCNPQPQPCHQTPYP